MKGLSREEIAKREIGWTNISPPLARTMVAAFVATIVAVPALQITHELRHDRSSASSARWPRCCALASLSNGVIRAFHETEGGLFTRIVGANAQVLRNIHTYESRLEDDSLLTRKLLGPTQSWLTRHGGLGNEKGYVGRDGWLFYRPGVEYLTGRGFLDPAVLTRRARSGAAYEDAPQPDPRPAILDLHRRLAEWNVRLILMPAPTKPMIEPEHLAARYRDDAPVLQNPSYDTFKAELEAAGVLVFDPAPLLRTRKERTGRPQFLESDTHWTPDAMQFIAARLGQYISTHVSLPDRPAVAYRSREAKANNLGDIAVMLRLPNGQDLFAPQSVTIRQVLQPDGTPWTPTPEADVLLLGDSFTNIYSMPEMNWGEGAGLAEQLSLALRRPVDRIAQNDAGAHATRQALALGLARGRDRLAGKRVLIWEFAARELAVGNWKSVPLVRKQARPAAPEPDPRAVRPRIVRGRIKARSSAPEPGSVPYRDAIVALHLTAVESAGMPSEIVVYLWGMRDNRWTPAARYEPGQQVSVRLTPWDQAQTQYGRFTRVELDDPDFALIDLPTFWGDAVP